MIPRTIFAEEHRIFRQQCRALFEKEFVPFHPQWERECIIPRNIWKLMGDAGLLNLETGRYVAITAQQIQQQAQTLFQKENSSTLIYLAE